MRAVIQRVSEASVYIENKLYSSIDTGILILVGIEENDDFTDIHWLAKKIYQLRIFNDKQGIMNLSLAEVKGQLMVVSQFTLHASTKKGNRPSYIKASKPEKAIPVYNAFVEELQSQSKQTVSTGIFGAEMKIHMINDGPVTIIIDTKNKE